MTIWIGKSINKETKFDEPLDHCVEEPFTADVIKANYQKYLDEKKEKVLKYRDKLCEKIKTCARNGQKYIITNWASDQDFITRDCLPELRDYFKSKGLEAEIVNDGIRGLYINWEDVVDGA